MIEMDAGFYFGIGAFETIAIKNKKTILLEEHLKRLHQTLHFLGISQTVTANEINDYLTEQNQTNCILKIAVSEKNIDFSHRTNPYTADKYAEGYVIYKSPIMRNESSPFTYHKTLNYAENIIARQLAQANHADEALFCNTKGEICEGSCTNIFFVSDGKLYTPAKECGLLPGIFRELLCRQEQAKKTIINWNDLEKFEECFVTNSILGIMKVRSIDNYTFESCNIAEALQRKYRNFF